MKFKLKDETPAEAAEQGQFYARALRAIGQDLSNLFPQFLEITNSGTNFHVAGRYVPRSASGKKAQPDGNLLGKIRTKLLRDQPGISTGEESSRAVDFSHSYSLADINQIDDVESSRRIGPHTAPDIYSLGEMLRMVGRIVDFEGKRLIGLRKDARSITFEFEKIDGQKRKCELSSLQFYKLQREYYADRGTYVPVDKWDNSL